jgi:hypothetical protein
MRKKITRYKAHIRTYSTGRHKTAVRRAAKHPLAIPVATFFALTLLFAMAFLVFTLRVDAVDPNVVLISRDGTLQTVASTEPTVGALLSKLQVALNEGDVVEPATRHANPAG